MEKTGDTALVSETQTRISRVRDFLVNLVPPFVDSLIYDAKSKTDQKADESFCLPPREKLRWLEVIIADPREPAYDAGKVSAEARRRLGGSLRLQRGKWVKPTAEVSPLHILWHSNFGWCAINKEPRRSLMRLTNQKQETIKPDEWQKEIDLDVLNTTRPLLSPEDFRLLQNAARAVEASLVAGKRMIDSNKLDRISWETDLHLDEPHIGILMPVSHKLPTLVPARSRIPVRS